MYYLRPLRTHVRRRPGHLCPHDRRPRPECDSGCRLAAFGLAGGTGSFDDLDRADCILLVGANPTEAHPVVGARLKQLIRRGARLVVIDPRRTELAEVADVHLAGRPGSNVAVFHGIAQLLVAGGHVDRKSVV